MGIWENQKEPIYNKWKEYWFTTHPSDVAVYTWDYLFTGGKEIRARLFCELWHYLSPDSNIHIELAFAIECIHVASLILDDSPWMDNASTRRGKQTLHLRFSPKKALLLCHDVMKIVHTIWLQHCPPYMELSVWKNILRNTLYRLTIGQYYDMEKKGTLIELASLKTGILFGLIGEMIGYWTGLDHHFWREWCNRIGVLFQWVDDWHDREEDAIQMNRNAFNENGAWTIHEYQHIWNDLCISIGPSWFDTSFGKYMKTYFTSIPILFETQTILSTLTSFPYFLPLYTSLSVPTHTYINKKIKSIEVLSRFEITDHFIESLLNLFNSNEDIEPLKTNLWEMPEQEWENVDEVDYLIERVQNGIK